MVASELLKDFGLGDLVVMASLRVECLQVGLLGAALLREGGILRLRGLQARVSGDDLHISLLLGLRDEVVGGCLRSVDKLHDVGLHLALGGVPLAFHLGNKDVLDLLSLDDGHFLVRQCTHAELVLLYLGTVDLRLEVLHLAIVVSLHVCQLLVLLVLERQLLVTVLLDVVRK